MSFTPLKMPQREGSASFRNARYQLSNFQDPIKTGLADDEQSLRQYYA